MSYSMQLCLVNNDPTATLLVTPDGIPLFSVETPPVPHINTRLTAVGEKRPKDAQTKIKRLERFHRSTGHVETEVGVVSYTGPNSGTQLRLSEEGNRLLEVPPRKALTNCEHEQEEDSDEEFLSDENAWEFTGSDSKRYRWQMFAHSPILLTADNALIPLARFRRAKIGIVSRSRRAFLEILPAGINIIDLIVTTFVAFMKQRVMIEDAAFSTGPTPATTPPLTTTPPVTPPEATTAAFESRRPPTPPRVPTMQQTPLSRFLSSSPRLTPDKLHLLAKPPSVASKS